MSRRYLALAIFALLVGKCESDSAGADDGPLPAGVASFGVDFAGEVYVMGGNSIYRIVAGT